MNACDLLISAPWVLPIAPQNVVLENHALAVTGSRIDALGPREELHATYQADTVIDLDQHILMPGLVNAHGHAAMSLLRGAGEDQPLEMWLNETIWPMEARLMSPDYVRLGSELAIAEMLLSGTTTFSDMYFYPEVVGKLCVELGMRAQLAFPLIEFENPWSENVTDALHKGLELFHHYRHEDLINIALGPHAAYTLSPTDMEQVGMYANELDIMVQIHLHETAAEVRDAHSRIGQSWISRLHEAGLLGPSLQAVHMTQITPEELNIVAESGTQVVHCPTSNLKLASGYCPVSDLQNAGVAVAIGTDGAASNNRLDMFDEARLASLMAKHEQHDAAQGGAADVVRMATHDGARVLGISDKTGSLQAGKAADFITVNTDALGLLPVYNPFAALVHGNAGNAVDNVFINGKQMVANGQLTCMSQSDLAQRVRSWHSAQAL
jgi:5-methylthioadenosine/S-adenosylhomocysteine deaminase